MPVRHRWALGLVLVLVNAWMAVPSEGASLPNVEKGDWGPAVVLLQDFLYREGLMTTPPDGLFGPETERAVKLFQRQAGLHIDGVAGPATWRELRSRAPRLGADVLVQPGDTLSEIALRYGSSVREVAATNGLADPDRVRAGTRLAIPGVGHRQPELALWPEVNALFPTGEVARVIDIETGRSFRVRRFLGSRHADVEPLTAADTQVMRSLYGGRWSWQRRAIVLELKGRRFAASMNGQPHGQGAVSNNRFSGHFCIHLMGSRTHGSGRADPDHQRRVMEAAGYDAEPVWVRYAN